jgi:metallo-beta-lactamase family protein
LIEWIGERQPIAGSLLLTHGESEAIETMRRELQRISPELSVRVPEIGETYALSPAKPAKRTATGRTDVQQAIGQDWQNSCARFTTGLKQELARIKSNKRRQEAIEEMRRVLESYTDFKRGKQNNAGP